MGGRASGSHRPCSFESGQDWALHGSLIQGFGDEKITLPARSISADELLMQLSSQKLGNSTTSAVSRTPCWPRRIPRRHAMLKALAEAGQEDWGLSICTIQCSTTVQISEQESAACAATSPLDTEVTEPTASLAPLPEPEPCSWQLEPEPCQLAEGSAPAGADNLEFELWVEAELEAGWCLPDPSASANESKGGGSSSSANCQSGGSLRRRWEDFEALGHSNHTLKLDDSAGEGMAGTILGPSDHLPIEVALQVLGLDPASEPSSAQIHAAFRQKSLTCHPDKVDKVNSSDEFNVLVAAYQRARDRFSAK
eukprot:TRINITY_DN51221_c0_g1_i1.p1 TRINITY_DN51221_c0_g1~~TRINITY_DN51221_c0_g1_i1.p1  ORF type:complete len:320 (+),score=37.02 TRINITY_DN51221_c0_g1_i1:32-961(+)